MAMEISERTMTPYVEDEVGNSFVDDVRELLAEYEKWKTYTDAEEERKNGAISALERLIEMWTE